jgi:hypothetical protein
MARGGALRRTYAGAVTKPTGNTATPCQSRKLPYTHSCSSEYTLEKPAMRQGSLAENP